MCVKLNVINILQVFDLLWRLISHDIWFVWERAEYLQGNDLDVLTQVPFKVSAQGFGPDSQSRGP